jgi:hypothetical protein
MATRRTVREVPPLDPAFEWTLPFVTAEDVSALAAKVRAHRRPIPLQVPAEQVAERLNRTVTRAIGTYEWRQTWKPAEYRDWAEKVADGRAAPSVAPGRGHEQHRRRGGAPYVRACLARRPRAHRGRW